METVLILFFILILAFIGVPLFIILSLVGLSFFSLSGEPLSILSVETYKIASSPVLITIPLFTFAGYILAESKTPERLLFLGKSLLGWLRGGVPIAMIVISAFFTAFSGASGVTIIALGGLLFPILKKEGFSDKFSLGFVTTSGSLGILFPPALPVIIYGMVGRLDIDDIFIAGIIPGFLTLLVVIVWAVKNSKSELVEPFKWSTLKLAIKENIFEIFLPIGVMTGIYGGYVTVSEAATLTLSYVLFVELFIHKDLKFFKDMPRILKESMTLVGAILLILCCALGVTNYFVDEDIPTQLLEVVKVYIKSKYVFLIFLNFFLLILGAFMDIFSAIVIVLPLILPIAEGFGIHPLHLSIIFLVNLEIGYMTPPLGINLFISSFRFKKDIFELYRASVPFILLLLGVLLLITYIPQLSLFWFK